MNLVCSFCAYYDVGGLDSATKIVVINGYSCCLDHAQMLQVSGDWIVALSKIQTPS